MMVLRRGLPPGSGALAGEATQLPPLTHRPQVGASAALPLVFVGLT